jgi:hypothetical protein
MQHESRQLTVSSRVSWRLMFLSGLVAGGGREEGAARC